MPPTLDLDPFLQFCNNLWKPQQIQGFLIVLLTNHFSLASNIEDPQLVNCVWTSDYRTTKIVIDSITRFDPKNVGLLPAVFLKRNPTQNQRIGIADRIFNYTQLGPQYFDTFWQGSHTLFCCGRTSAEAEHVAVEVQREVGQFAWTLARALNLFKLQVAAIGEASKIEEAVETYAVPVTVTYAYEEVWQVVQDAPILKNIQYSFFEP